MGDSEDEDVCCFRRRWILLRLAKGNGGVSVTKLASVARRFGWGLADQALSSLTNLAVGLFAARTLSSSDFGVFTLIFAAYLVALGAVRAITGEPLLVRYATASGDEWRTGVAEATGIALMTGVVGSVVCGVISLAVSSPLRSGVLALALMMPGLLLQDAWRFAFISGQRGRNAFGNDLTWAATLMIGSALLLLAEGNTLAGLVIVWGGTGTLAGLFGILQASILPAPKRAIRWLRTHKDLIPRFLGEFAVTVVVIQLTVFGLAALATLQEAGALRAGQLLLGPLNVVFLGMGLIAVPDAAIVLRISEQQLLRTCRRISVYLASLAIALGVFWSVIPSRFGSLLLGDSWTGARGVVVPLSLAMAGFAGSLGAGIGLRALAAARLSLRAKLIVAPVSLGTGLTGAALGGAGGAAWGMAASSAWGAAVWWWSLVQGVRLHVAKMKETDVRA
jgi:O-antigen/teichoic acid export membrane protein